MRERFAASCEDPDEKLTEFLEGDMEPEDFWQLAQKNLQDRNIRLLFVADEIPTELQRIVEFLNEQMDRTEVLALEIKQFKGGGRTGLVPRVIGRTAEAQQKKSAGSRVVNATLPKRQTRTIFLVGKNKIAQYDHNSGNTWANIVAYDKGRARKDGHDISKARIVTQELRDGQYVDIEP
jgi:hypothetical protein